MYSKRESTSYFDVFQRDRLLEDWGWTTVKLSSANTYSYDKRDVSLNHYCKNMIKPQRKDTLANGILIQTVISIEI